MCYEVSMHHTDEPRKTESRDLQTFHVGQIVSILDIADLQDIEIERISDSGVYATNTHHRKGVMLSCRSPARLTHANRAALEAAREESKAAAVSQSLTSRASASTRRAPAPSIPAPSLAQTTTLEDAYGLVSYRSQTA